MKLDMDLIRIMLMGLETGDAAFAGGNPSVTADHARLLAESPLAERAGAEGWPARHVPLRLTSRGREFLDLARDDARWEEAKRRVSGATGDLNFDLLDMTLKDLAMRPGTPR